MVWEQRSKLPARESMKSIRTKKMEGRIKQQYLSDCMTWRADVTSRLGRSRRGTNERPVAGGMEKVTVASETKAI